MFDPLIDFWNGIVGALAQALLWLHDGLEPLTGELAWGFAIIVLTVIIRLLLVPLAVKQINSMRAMQRLQPKIKKIQNKYDTDRGLLKKDPERYKDQRQKMNEEMMALYQEEGVNPASGCLPLLAQAPIFFALFEVLRSTDIGSIQGLQDASFFFLPALGTRTLEAGWPGWLMIGLMVGTMFLSQRQMMSSRGGDGSSGMQQKVMLYGMPVFLAFVAQQFPLGVLVYWVTTNVWQFGQQSIILREIGDGEGSPPDGASSTKDDAGSSDRSGAAASGDGSQNGRRGGGSPSREARKAAGTETQGRRKGHTPTRRS